MELKKDERTALQEVISKYNENRMKSSRLKRCGNM